MRTVLLISTIALAACTSNPEPVADLKASKNPQLFLSDWQECEWIVEKYNLEAKTALVKCLDGRGHSTLGLQDE